MSSTIVITGVTRGLGRALAKQFSFMGHTVIGCGRNKDILKILSKSLPKNTDFKALDISDHGMVRSWAKEILGKFDVPDYLINNAAVINKNAPLWKVPFKEFSELIDINVKGTYNTIKSFLPEMIKYKKGTIVNFSSGWGRTTSAQVAPYCSSKWAIEGLSKSLSQELPDSMISVALSPGVIDTDKLRSCNLNARLYEKPESWAKRAAPYILNIKQTDNGESLTIS